MKAHYYSVGEIGDIEKPNKIRRAYLGRLTPDQAWEFVRRCSERTNKGDVALEERAAKYPSIIGAYAREAQLNFGDEKGKEAAETVEKLVDNAAADFTTWAMDFACEKEVAEQVSDLKDILGIK